MNEDSFITAATVGIVSFILSYFLARYLVNRMFKDPREKFKLSVGDKVRVKFQEADGFVTERDIYNDPEVGKIAMYKVRVDIGLGGTYYWCSEGVLTKLEEK